jgi:hypothetical protein
MTRTDQSPMRAGGRGPGTITASSTFLVSAEPPEIEPPLLNVPKLFPRYTVPSGAVSSRWRSFTRTFAAFNVAG